MPTTNEEVKYSFTADNSGLVKTVTENISRISSGLSKLLLFPNSFIYPVKPS